MSADCGSVTASMPHLGEKGADHEAQTDVGDFVKKEKEKKNKWVAEVQYSHVVL